MALRGLHRSVHGVLGVLLAVRIALGGAVAAAVTFGADLTLPANNTGTCALMSAPSCTFLSGAPGPSFYAPLTGTVTAVRVKTGEFPQGPMQLLVMRSLYQNHAGDPGHPYFACCFVERYGPIFTPAPNAVTVVETALPMIEDPIPPPEDTVTNARGDFLALSVLAPDVPVPASYDGGSVFSGFAPAPDPQTTPAPSPNPIFPVVNGLGYQLTMNADLDVGGGGPGDLPVTIATGGQLLGTTAAIPLTCVLTTACHGVLRLAGAATPAAAVAPGPRAARGAKSYGKRRFAIAAGATKTVRVRLNAAGRREARGLASVALTASARIGTRTVATDVTVTRP
jgi:hypothetical protein